MTEKIKEISIYDTLIKQHDVTDLRGEIHGMERRGIYIVKRLNDKNTSPRPSNNGAYTMEPFIVECYDKLGQLISRAHKMTNAGHYSDKEWKYGLYEEFDQQGRKIFECRCEEDIMKGPYKIFWKNGQVREEGTMQGALFVGKVKGYFSNGELKYELECGQPEKYHVFSKGDEMAQVIFLSDKVNGRLSSFEDDYRFALKREPGKTPEEVFLRDSDGALVEKEVYSEKDTLMADTLYYKGGKKKAELVINEKDRVGYLTTWNENGKVLLEGIFKDGKFIDEATLKKQQEELEKKEEKSEKQIKELEEQLKKMREKRKKEKKTASTLRKRIEKGMILLSKHNTNNNQK